MTDYYLTAHDADDVNSYLIRDGDDWIIPPSLPGATDRVMIAGMRSGNLHVAAILGYSGNFDPFPSLDSPASISGGTVSAGSAPKGLLIGNSSGHTHASVTINGKVTGDVSVTDGDVTAASIDGNVSVFEDGNVIAESITGSVSVGGGGEVHVSSGIDASDGFVAAGEGTIIADGKIVTQGFTTNDGGVIQAASIVYDGTVRSDGTVRMLNYMSGGQVLVNNYNITNRNGSSSRLDILEGAFMRVVDGFGFGRLSKDRDGVYVDGLGSNLQLSSSFVAGDQGHGSLTISNGGLVGGLSDLTLGNQKSGEGIIGVSGADSEFNLTGDLVVANAGKGSLSVREGGVVAGVLSITLGKQQSGKGTITVDGPDAEFNMSGNLVVADRGKGSLTVSNGGLFAAVEDLTIGKEQSGKGKITIDGEHSEFNVSGEVVIGDLGTGVLTIAHHAQVVLNDVFAGTRKSGVGAVAVDGAQLTAHSLEVGAGAGGILVDNAGIAILDNLILGVHAGSEGVAGIDHGALLRISKTVIIGDKGVGTVEIIDGTFESEDGVTIGREGEILVHGQDNSVQGTVRIDRTTTIERGGLLQVKGAFADVTLDSVEMAGRISVAGGNLGVGELYVKSTLEGHGEIAIGKNGDLTLDGIDRNVDIRFTASGPEGGSLHLLHADLLQDVIIKGFAKGNLIVLEDQASALGDLDVARRGANTVVTIIDDDGDAAGRIVLAGRYTAASLIFGTDGSLTTTKAGGAHAAGFAAHDDFVFAHSSTLAHEAAANGDWY